LRKKGAKVAVVGSAETFAVEVTDEKVLDTILRIVADLEVGLVRMQQRRHHLTEIFQTEKAATHE